MVAFQPPTGIWGQAGGFEDPTSMRLSKPHWIPRLVTGTWEPRGCVGPEAALPEVVAGTMIPTVSYHDLMVGARWGA